MPSVDDQRSAVVAEALSWIGTPFRHAARLKGVGTDCNGFLAETYRLAGVCGFVPFPYYPADWFLHSNDDRYLKPITDLCTEVEGPVAGDIVLFRLGKPDAEGLSPWSHGAVIVAWPLVVHARWKSCVEYDDVTRYPLSSMKERAFYSPKVWHP